MKIENISKESLLKILENMQLVGKILSNGDLEYVTFWKDSKDEYGENPHITKIIIDPLKELEYGTEKAIVSTECDCNGCIYRKGDCICKHKKMAIDLLKIR